MKRYLSVVLVAAVAAAGCFKVTTSPSPVNSTSQLLGGTWVTVESIPGATLNESCTNFTWAVTDYTGQTAKGSFSAKCFGNVNIAGTAQSASDRVSERQRAMNAALDEHGKQLQGAFDQLTSNVSAMAQSAADRLGERQESMSAALDEHSKKLGEATIEAGSPGRREPWTTLKSLPDTRFTASITSRTDRPRP